MIAPAKQSLLQGGWGDWLLSLLFLSPLLVYHLARYWLADPVVEVTGFVSWDMPAYMAMARQYFDEGFFPLFRLPFDHDLAAERIYFQPLTLLLGLLEKATKADPSFLYLGVGFLFGLLMFRAAIWLFRLYVPSRGPALLAALICFLWGGGLLVVGAIAGHVLGLTPNADLPLRGQLLQFDPFSGFWFLNLGRNVIFTTEAFYHLIVFLLLVALIKERRGAAFALLFVLSVSSPWTGLQFLLIVSAYLLLRQLLGLARVGDWAFLAAVLALLTLHLAYYLWFLSTNESHSALKEQWTLAWTLPVISSILAYGPLLLLSLLSLRRGLFQPTRQAPHLLLACVVFCSWALENHELVISPVQPLHFTRGYSWMALALTALPLLVEWFEEWRRRWMAWPVVVFIGFALLDNFTFFVDLASKAHNRADGAVYLEPSRRRMIEANRNIDPYESLVVCENFYDCYLLITYTPAVAFTANDFSTPDFAQKTAAITRWLGTGAVPEEWQNRDLIFLLRRSWDDYRRGPAWLPQDSLMEQGADWAIFKRARTPS